MVVVGVLGKGLKCAAEVVGLPVARWEEMEFWCFWGVLGFGGGIRCGGEENIFKKKFRMWRGPILPTKVAILQAKNNITGKTEECVLNWFQVGNIRIRAWWMTEKLTLDWKTPQTTKKGSTSFFLASGSNTKLIWNLREPTATQPTTRNHSRWCFLILCLERALIPMLELLRQIKHGFIQTLRLSPSLWLFVQTSSKDNQCSLWVVCCNFVLQLSPCALLVKKICPAHLLNLKSGRIWTICYLLMLYGGGPRWGHGIYTMGDGSFYPGEWPPHFGPRTGNVASIPPKFQSSVKDKMEMMAKKDAKKNYLHHHVLQKSAFLKLFGALGPPSTLPTLQGGQRW